MTTKYDLYETLKPIVDLYKQAENLLVWQPEEMERIGLINAKERAVLDQARQAENEVSKAEYNAEKSIPDPDLYGAYPAEFVELRERKDKLNRQHSEMEAVIRTILNLKPSNWGFQNSIATFINVGSLAKDVGERLRDLPDPVYTELGEVRKTIDNKSRSNSKVVKIREALWAEHGKTVKRVKAEARSKAEGQYAELFRKRDALNNLINSRRQERLAPIKEQIEQILKKGLGELGKG